MLLRNKTKKRHIVLWGGWYGSHNVGDESLLLTITGLLEKTFGDVEFIVPSSDPEHVVEYTSQASRAHICALHNWSNFPQLIHSLTSCDLLVFGGGAPFFEQRKHLLVMATIVGVVRAFRKPYMTWTVSSQIVQSHVAKLLFGWVLNSAKAITYRDEHTLYLFQSCGVKKPMYLSSDSGFWLEPEGDEEALELIRRSGLRDESRPLVALTPRTLRGKDGDAETHYNIKTPEQFGNEIACFVAVLDWLWENGYQPIFVPMNIVPPDDDRIAFYQIKEQARHGQYALMIVEDLRPRLAPAIYRQCFSSFVARVHGSILSMVANCPMMMYAFAPKHVGIMESMRMSKYCLQEKEATPEKAIQIMSDLIVNRNQLKRDMTAQLEVLRQNGLIPVQLAAQILNQ